MAAIKDCKGGGGNEMHAEQDYSQRDLNKAETVEEYFEVWRISS